MKPTLSYRIILICLSSLLASCQLVNETTNSATSGGGSSTTTVVASECITSQSIVPDLTSTNTPAPYAVTTSADWGAGYEGWNSFQTVTYRYGWWPLNGQATGWMAIDLGSSQSISSYSFQSYSDPTEWDCYPTSWTFEGSNDGVNWNVLDTQTGISFSAEAEFKSFSLSAQATWQHYRFNVSAHNACGYNTFGIGRFNICN